MYKETQLPCLVIFCSGVAARKLEEKQDADIHTEIMTMLSSIFPYETPLPYPIESVITRRSLDNYNNASESSLSINVSPDKHSKIVWAGRNSASLMANGIHGSR